MNEITKTVFLASFLPALAYWYLEENYSLEIALIGGGLLAIIEMTLEKVLSGKIHTLSKFNFFLIVVLGGIAFIAKEGIWFKLQPFFTGLLMGGYLLYRLWKKESLMLEMMKSMHTQNNLPDEVVLILERNMAIFVLLYGVFMAIIALSFDTSTWLFFKTGGFYIATFIFFIIHFIFIRRQLSRP